MEIELSVMANNPQADNDLRRLLEAFEAQHRVRVKLEVLAWENAWEEIVKYTLYRHGPDVSEIGSTWIGSLVGMRALRPYASADVAGPEAFLPTAWQAGLLRGDKTIWAIPWLADVRTIYYRRDLLEKAGVDLDGAFQTAEAVERTLNHLPLDTGVSPWVAPTQLAHTTMHNLAMWLWSVGGDFIDPDKKQVLFNRPEALAAMRAYFDLRRYMTPDAKNLGAYESDRFFYEGKAAMTLCGPWAYRRAVSTELSSKINAALPPGAPFLGGSNLVIWGHVGGPQERAALELVRFLTSQPVQAAYSRAAGLLPVSLKALSESYFTESPVYRVMVDGLKKGRAFPSVALWGSVEDKLTPALADIWHDLLVNPAADSEAVIARHLLPVAQRLELTLKR